MAIKRPAEELSTCTHGGKLIFHDEPVCPVCEDAVRRGRSLHDLEEAMRDVFKVAKGNPSADTVKLIGAWRRMENLIARIHGGMTNGNNKDTDTGDAGRGDAGDTAPSKE